MNILVSGLVNIETTVAVRGFPIGYYPIDYIDFGVGSNVSGVGYNLAKALTSLGDNVDLCSFIGEDEEADRIIARMDKDGIDSRHIRRGLRQTPASAVLYDPQGRRQIYCDLKDIQEQRLTPEEALDSIGSCDAAVLCNINFNRSLLGAVKERGIPIATDVHVLGDIEDDYNRDFMTNADILFLSDEKLPCDPRDFITRLHDRYHNGIIVIGMGAKGAMLLSDGVIREIPAYGAGRIVNTVGAGDALFSAFLHFYLRSGDAEAALRRAVIFAGVKIASNGASVGFCTEREVEDRFRSLNR